MIEKEKERWKCIKDTSQKYYISSHGRLMSLKYNKVRFLKFGHDKDGYLQGMLSVNGKPYKYKVHRLVALYFVDNPLNKPQVNHIYKDVTDNYYKHLEWVTNSQNVLHGLGKEYK